jgi:type VI secretion system protein ImpK
VTELLAYTYHLADRLQTDDVPYDQVSGHYQQLILRAKTRAKSAGIPVHQFDQALFAVFAWIDETLLGTGWIHKQEWIKNSLQKKIFNTTSAGTEFFAKLEKLGPEDKDILEVYDYCLASGFKGCFYEPLFQEKLNAIKTDTRKKFTDGIETVPEILFPEAGDLSFFKRLKRKRWKGLSGYSALFVLIPVLLFFLLYYFFNAHLIQRVESFGVMLK